MKAQEELFFKAQLFAIEAHASSYQFYDKDKPYSFHLEMVYKYGDKYAHLLPTYNDKVIALSSCWTHDLIENCRLTYKRCKRGIRC